MKKAVCFFLSLVMIAAVCPLQAFAADNTLTIKKDNISHAVSDHLYGAFLEDISFACDGGLVAELVNNGSFEYEDKPETAWTFSNVDAVLAGESPMNANNPSYEILTVDGRGMIENIGFPELYDYKTYDYDEKKAQTPDMGFREGESYAFSCYVKNIDFEGSVSVYLDSKHNADNAVQLPTAGISEKAWTKLEATLTSAADEDGGLAIVLDGTGTLALDFVSLVPQSSYGWGSDEWQNTSLRQDLFDALKNLNPSFLRFPGGCLAEGTDLAHLYSWKDTIGPLTERKQHPNLWSDANSGRYDNNTNAMGYHEYFQLCEDLQADAVPVVNVGLTCQARNGYDDHVIALQKTTMSDEEWRAYLINERGYDEKDEEGIQGYTDWINSLGIQSEEDFEAYLDTIALRPGTDAFKNYVQDILDLVEYANGDAQTTYWGALRAGNGHTEPFHLKYLSLGNENWGDVYFRNFDAIYKAVKKAHPELQLISSAGAWLEGTAFDNAWETINEKYADTIVDEHYYTGEKYLFGHNDRYDSYDRDGAGVFIGEYSAKAQGFGTMITKTNIYSAVEEASFMTGFERNSDIVKMSSYAPAFAKINANAWDLNMVWFDSREVVLTPDYYNQMLFSNNTGTQYADAAFSEENDSLYRSVTYDDSKNILYVKLVNSGSSTKVTLRLDGFDSIHYASNQSISHKYKSASNELGKQRVAPKDEELETAEDSLTLDVKANSVNVVRIALGETGGEALYQLPDTIDYKIKSYIPIKVKAGIAVILVALAVGMAAGYLIYTKLIFKRKQK